MNWDSLTEQAVPVVIGTVLLWAGIDKLRNPRPLAETLRRLTQAGSDSQMLLIARGLGVTEVATALLVTARPVPWLGEGLTVALAVVFALAGVRALLLKERVDCACFFGVSTSLGRPQLALLPVWVVATAGVWALSPGDANGSGPLLAVLLLSCLLRALVLVREVARAAGDRRAAQEWLRSR